MPGMSGEQLAAAVREISPDTPVILLTGFSEYEVERENLENVTAVLAKPISLTDLRQAIAKTMLEFHRRSAAGASGT